jgi:anti-sigma factor RsiW
MFVSLDLDGELSRFERALLARHLRNCPRCAEKAKSLVELTEVLRADPLLPVPARIVVTRQRRRVGRVVQSAIAGAAVIVVGIWFGLESSTSRSPRPEGLVNPRPSAAAIAASDGSHDWPAGLPHSRQVTQLVPGGLYTSGSGPDF